MRPESDESKRNGVEDRGATPLSIQEAEFAVQSSITVREGYKATLQSLLGSVSTCSAASSKAAAKANSHRVTKNGSKATKASVQGAPEGKELHIMGDRLLLLRAASVSVVEKIHAWRQIVHQGRPHPFLYENTNYLLAMCEDLDFLDQCVDLVEWLGFRLARNPFIVQSSLDDAISEDMQKDVRQSRALYYWSSSSWQKQRQKKTKLTIAAVKTEANPYVVERGDGASERTKTRRPLWRARPPPQALVKPLVSILPEDDIVDGARIETALRQLLEEEGLYGRVRALRIVRQYLVDVVDTKNECARVVEHEQEPEQGNAFATVYDAIASISPQLSSPKSRVSARATELQLALHEREQRHVLHIVEDLKNQMMWTERCRDSDLTKDHRVWRFRDTTYKETTRMFSVLMAELSMRLDVLSDAISHLKLRMNAQQNQLQQYEREKEKLRIEKHEQKRREEECWRAEMRQKTVERTSKFKAKKKATNMLGSRHKSETLSSEDISKLEALVFKDVTPLVESTIGSISQQRRTHFEELEEKRCRANLLKELAREEHARAALDAARKLERRRYENVQMKREDDLASALERLVRRKQRLKSLKLRLERIASTPLFSCIQLLSGKKWRITMYEQRARGYMLDGLHIVAYDPTSSASCSSHMTTREYTSLGYGRTREGLSTFCKWLCLLYEKRKRHFRLIWSGPPCPPPLRVREYDSVVCIHKEGVKLSVGRKSAGYALISVFVRPNARTRLHFVMSSLKTTTSSSMEKVVYAPMLIHDGALQLCYGDHDDSYVVWKHESGHQRVPPNQNRTSEIRVYSGEMRIQSHSVLVHVFDISSTEYALELHPLSPSTLPPELLSMCTTHKRTTLLKHEVNPYDVRLPLSAFGDLLAEITFSPSLDCHAGILDSDGASSAEWKPMVSPKWIDTMAKYVRVLRLARFGCRVDRKHFLVTLSIVQQKTEFRSYLLLELTCLSGSSMRKQPLRVSLSSYLRCGNVMNRIFPFDTEGDEGCHMCDDDMLSGRGGSTTCASCDEIQVARLAGVRNLIVNRQLAAEAMPIDYHGYCRLCGTLAKPILLIVHSLTAAGAEVLELLGYHFSCFDLADLHSANGSALAADLRQAIDVERIVVGLNADCGATMVAASEFTRELHWSIYPELHEFSFHVVLVVDNAALLLDQWGTSSSAEHASSRDHDIRSALAALSVAASHIGDQEPISMAVDGADDGDVGALNFEAYLVSEALLVEATRVLLQPDLPWRRPRETVGASSWSTACEFMRDPQDLSVKLHAVNLATISWGTQEILNAYLSHPKWPHTYDEVRPCFHGLLSYMLHISHVQELIRGRGGLLHEPDVHVTDDEIGAHEGPRLQTKVTSVIFLSGTHLEDCQ